MYSLTMFSPAALAQLSGKVVAIKIPEIRELLETCSVSYRRPDSVLVEARRATMKDTESPLTTFVTDRHGNLLIESEKKFSKEEIDSGIIILRYPAPICEQQYNEWYVTKKEWEEKYIGNPGEEWASYKTKNAVIKHGLDITPKVIRLLGGENGRAEISAPWGGTMWALDGGLLTKEGSAIAPQILERYFYKFEDKGRNVTLRSDRPL
ncbi:hypothetical protein EV426DRAFT_597046 [Tirmania nivea]|nr:hypothetical protein EV426DRAFT_597046 [Tirmania nivea]